jgi:hypothetical protein
MKPLWDFKQHGETGHWASNLFPNINQHIDDLCFFHGMHTEGVAHGPATLFLHTGTTSFIRPSMGAWVMYGLGAENENLPGFVTISPSLGNGGPRNYGNAFLPAIFQGTPVGRSGLPAKESTIKNITNTIWTPEQQRKQFSLLSSLNAEQAARAMPGDTEIDAVIRSYELAARMQLAAPEALDISRESPATRAMYGIRDDVRHWPKEINDGEEIDAFGRKCLAARRLLERGVRFVQIWSGNDNGFPRRNWDSHEDVERDHGPLARGFAHGASAFLRDLKQRGLLDDTIVLWTTEFGRMPSSQGGRGRDHNPFCFTNWLCGGGIRGGATHGSSDEFGFKPADRSNVTEVYDVHATILHLLGIDHEQLTVRAGGVDRRLTDVHGHVIRSLLA